MYSLCPRKEILKKTDAKSVCILKNSDTLKNDFMYLKKNSDILKKRS